jgi:hypothetical protein
MRKLLILLSFCMFTALSINAQQGQFTNPNGAVVDTLTNTTAERCTMRLPGLAKVASFTIELTTLSGTVAGKVYLQGGSRADAYGSNSLDSVTLVAGTANYTFSKVDPGHQYYSLYIVPTGTQSTAYKAYYYIRKP